MNVNNVSQALNTRESTEKKAKMIVRSVGGSPRYKGYDFLIQGICEVVENPHRLQQLCTLYQFLGDKFQVSAQCIERNIRSINKNTWNSPTRRKRLMELADIELDKCPTTGEFIAILASAIDL